MVPSEQDRTACLERTIARVVLAYVFEHPDARDTARGIGQWWVPRALARGVVSRHLAAALDDLVARGWLTADERVDAPAVYGVDRSKLTVIKRFLES